MKLPIGTYSFYNQFENCPHKAAHIYVMRTVPYVESPEMKWGNDVHKALENRIKYGSPLPDTMRVAEPTAALFAGMIGHLPVVVEHQLAMTQDGKPCDWGAPNAFFRGKLDLVTMNGERTHAWMIDWKTGNVREDPFELQCGALLLRVHHDTLAKIQGEYYWLKVGQAGLRYTFKDHGSVYDRLVRLRIEAEGYLRDKQWPKRKNPLCGWCPVTSCEHNTSHKRESK